MQQRSLEFHIQQNDYFGTLATVLDLMRQDLDRKGYPRHSATLTNVCQGLIELQHEYHLRSDRGSLRPVPDEASCDASLASIFAARLK